VERRTGRTRASTEIFRWRGTPALPCFVTRLGASLRQRSPLFDNDAMVGYRKYHRHILLDHDDCHLFVPIDVDENFRDLVDQFSVAPWCVRYRRASMTVSLDLQRRKEGLRSTPGQCFAMPSVLWHLFRRAPFTKPWRPFPGMRLRTVAGPTKTN